MVEKFHYNGENVKWEHLIKIKYISIKTKIITFQTNWLNV